MKESDVRPPALFQRYLELSAEDARTFFAASPRQELPCPACGSSRFQRAFEKFGFAYASCEHCATLYQSPRPAREAFTRFYQESPSARYWANTFFPAVAEARRLKLIRPKVQEVARLCEQERFCPHVLADVGAGSGLFLEEWHRCFPETKLLAVEPNPDAAAQCRARNFNVMECFLEEVASPQERVDLATAFEVIEHVHDPLGFCGSLRELVKPGGRVLITGLTVDGFDIQVLWQHSRSVFPPHHLNFLSIQGFATLLSRSGFSGTAIFTPGKLDVDIVQNAVAANDEVLTGQRFVRTLLGRDEETLTAFQEFLREHRLSSHCWAWGRA